MNPSSYLDPDISASLTTSRLPVLPQLLVKLLECCRSDKMDMTEVAGLIGKDAAMTAKVFALASGSTRYRAPQPVDLKRVLMTLGDDMVRSLLISESAVQTFSPPAQSGGTQFRRFWKRSLSAALTARIIAIRIGYADVEEAYLAGLLHDFGRLLLSTVALDEEGSDSLAAGNNTPCVVGQARRSITPSEAGAGLIERWNLDSFLCDSVRYHQESPARLEKTHPLIRIVFLAYQVSCKTQNDPALTAAGSICGLALTDLAQIRSDVIDQVNDTCLSLGVDLAAGGPQSAAPQPVLATVQEQLADGMRELVLLSEVRRCLANQQEEAKLFEAATASARLLFDFEDAIILQLGERGDVLRGTAAAKHGRRGAELIIPLDNTDAVAQAALHRRLTYIWQDEPSLGVAEEQLLRMLGAACLVCLPLVTADRSHGVMIGAASSSQLGRLQSCERFLQNFGAEVAAASNKIFIERSEADRERASIRGQYFQAARNAAHEANNPLAILKNYLGVLERKLAKQEPVSAEMAILNEEIDRVSRIVNGLADLQPSLQDGAAEINRIVADVVHLFRHTEYALSSVRIVTCMQDTSFEVEGDSDTLKQILVNLIKNAIEALPGGGEITIGSNGPVNRDGLLYVALWVSDTGPGISADIMATLFSPIRSTKGEGHRGLGLSIVHALVKKIHGAIICRSDSNGTTFEILLPGRAAHKNVSHAGAESRIQSP